ncbi:MAG: hypothetical protein ACR2JD_07600 [Nocardioides sp.]
MEDHEGRPVCRRPEGLLAARRLDPTGAAGPTRRRVVGRAWQRIAPGLYVPSDRPQCVEQRILEQSARLPAVGAVTGWAALRSRGAAFFDGTSDSGADLPVPLALSVGNIRPHAGSALSWEQLGPSEREWVDGVWLTTVQRSVFDEMRRVDSLLHRVRTVEMAAAARLISVALLRRYVARRPAWTGVPAAREALGIAVDTSRSPRETWMRLLWLRCGHPQPVCNQPVFDLDGALIGSPRSLRPRGRPRRRVRRRAPQGARSSPP